MAKNFGGLGGMMGVTPDREPEDEFEAMLADCFEQRMKADGTFCVQLWSALANIEWYRSNGDTASYSFRAAGDMIAAILGEGDYFDWYCSGPYATVSTEIESALAAKGWHWRRL